MGAVRRYHHRSGEGVGRVSGLAGRSPFGRPNVRPVLASTRVGASRRPSTGSAKQSRVSHIELDCFVASLLAMTVDVWGRSYHIDALARSDQARS
ncbi:hypothetical protein DNX69_18470 [Rhodopseudomonas palustris]|uniref:Uncharacterized protein n=1 Tax=Rhodopseudomonas palustris TaxID=1076 RepID=A0A323UGB3_RHOPL|nr:hypothetical protein DNX69_18470 [Rhodopseudomonas palustris]